jgi:hypothetical protein
MSWHWARQGWTIGEIAAPVEHHPATVSHWLRNGGAPAKRQTDPALLVVNGHWASRITEILKANSNLLGTSVERLLWAEGFDGSYPGPTPARASFASPTTPAAWPGSAGPTAWEP